MKPSRASIAVAVVLASAALAVPAAGALSSKPGHRPAATGASAELHRARAALARATSQLANIRRRIGTGALRRQVSQVERTLGTVNARLKATETRLRLSPLAVAIEQVRREVAYVQGGVSYPRGQLISEAAMDYVVGHVSDTAFGYLEVFGGRLPEDTPDSALRTQAGVCAEAAVTFAAIVHHFGFPVRSVNFNYVVPSPVNAPDGHIAVEVDYGGSWHYFDPTYGLVWTDAKGAVLPISDVRAGLGTLQKDVASFTNVFEDAVLGNDTWFETDPATQVLFGFTKLIR